MDGLGLLILARFSLFTHRIIYLGVRQHFFGEKLIYGLILGRDVICEKVSDFRNVSMLVHQVLWMVGFPLCQVS